MLPASCVPSASQPVVVSPHEGESTLPNAENAEPRSPCRVDFDEVQRLVEGSYAGYSDKRSRIGDQPLAEVATSIASEASALEGEAGDPACAALLQRYVETFEDGHLTVIESNRPPPNPGSPPDPKRTTPTFHKVSARIVVVKVPSFGKPTEVADLIEQHRLEIRRSEHLILDLRGNGGGSDVAYAPLMKYVYSGPYRVIGTNVLATPDNVAAWERLLQQIPENRSDVRKQIADAVELMRSHPGELVELSPDRTITRDEVLPLPRRVSIVHDAGCASSCEQFLLAARQSSKVTTYGQTSAGVLDYANVRFVQLPSKARALAWATTRSRRLPAHPIDGVGIAPDVVVKPEALADLDPDGLVRITARRK
jgi:hypothetical protein